MTVKEILKGIRLAVLDRGYRGEMDTVSIMLRNDLLDADTLSFLLNAEELPGTSRLCLIVESGTQFQKLNHPYLDLLNPPGREVVVVQKDSPSFVSSLLRTRLLILTHFEDLLHKRLFLGMRRRRVVRVYHGVITKGYLRLMPRRPRKLGARLAASAARRWLHVCSVASDVELYFRATAEGRHPEMFRKWGYPRYDRLRDLLSGRREPVLPDASRTILTRLGRRNILYAPTHKDGRYVTTLFPAADFDLDALRAFLREHDLNLLLRMHTLEEKRASHRELVDGEYIHDAGREFSPSPVEMLPYVDLLITDYSSMYMDFLLFDRPIVFMAGGEDAFNEIRGLAFDYETYFPGPKVTSTTDLLAAIRGHLVERADDHAGARAFVRDTFLPDGNGRFMAHMARLMRDDAGPEKPGYAPIR